MSEQGSTQVTPKRRRSRQAGQENSIQSKVLQPSANDDKEVWEVYWKQQGQPWRSEPEIDKERQKNLDERRSIRLDMEQGIYPFNGIKLSRAEVEWLLATHENGQGPVDWSYESQRKRSGLDLRGADLRGVDLSRLPLACLCGGEYTKYEWLPITHTLSDIAGVRLEDTNLSEAHLEGANLIYAHLERSNLDRAHFEEADLRLAHLEEANLHTAHLEGANFYRAHLEAASLNGAYLSTSTQLRDITLGNKQLGFVFLGTVHWDDVDLSVVDWTQMHSLGNEYRAHQRRSKNGERKDTATRLLEYRSAVRANRRLAVALQAQGLNEDAARFAYRAQFLQRKEFWYQGIPKFGQYLLSLFLALLAGYGYKLWRSLVAYLLVIVGFAAAYYLLGPTTNLSLSPLDAIIFSMTSFHGRGFSPGENIGLSNPLTILAAIEAFVGLVIEVTLIATLTQRFFGK